MMRLTSSSIHIRNLRLHAFHGVLPQERMVGNDYEISLKMAFPIGRAVGSDDVADTLNYAQACDIVRKAMRRPVNLLEKAAANVAANLFAAFPALTVIDIRLTKLNPPMGADCDGAGVEVRFTSSPHSCRN